MYTLRGYVSGHLRSFESRTFKQQFGGVIPRMDRTLERLRSPICVVYVSSYKYCLPQHFTKAYTIFELLNNFHIPGESRPPTAATLFSSSELAANSNTESNPAQLINVLSYATWIPGHTRRPNPKMYLRGSGSGFSCKYRSGRKMCGSG